jgi:hypothetical protein
MAKHTRKPKPNADQQCPVAMTDDPRIISPSNDLIASNTAVVH